MRTDHAVTRMSSDRVAMRPIVNRMTHACENFTFPCGWLKGHHLFSGFER